MKIHGPPNGVGRFSDKILEENNYDVLWVVNSFRPETRDIEGALEIKREIETVCDLKFTGIVNNTNLGLETTVEHIKKGYDFCNALSKVTGLPVKFSSVRCDLITKEINNLGKILPVEPIKYGDWL